MADEPRRRPWRRRVTRALLVLAGLAAGYLVALLLGMPMGWPYDYPANLGFTPDRADLALPDDGRRRVVVLQHGILRSSYALGRLERTLARHGYEVHNLDYPSNAGTLEQHADTLAAAVEEIAGAGPVDEWSFVGHSMGGLVIQELLRRPGAPAPKACVYIATPHRGALLADLRKHWFLYRWIMGTTSAAQLSPGHAFHERPIRFAERSGVILGDIGEGNDAIPGRDDGTVGVDEARLDGAAATLVLPYGHTRIAAHPRTAEQVLVFLRTGRFEQG